MKNHDNDPCGCCGRPPLPGQLHFFQPENPGETSSDQHALAPAVLEAGKAAGIVPSEDKQGEAHEDGAS